jgi:hypothetical protein
LADKPEFTVDLSLERPDGYMYYEDVVRRPQADSRTSRGESETYDRAESPDHS